MSACAAVFGAHGAFVSLAPASWYGALVAGDASGKELEPGHPLARRVRAVAERLSVPAQGLRVFVSASERASSLGVPFRVFSSSAVVTLPASFATAIEEEDAGDWLLHGEPLCPTLVLPTEGEMDFTIAHELTHIRHADSLVGALTTAASLVLGYEGGNLLAERIAPARVLPLHVQAGFRGVAAVAASAASIMLLTRYQEWRADRGAARAGFALGGLYAFERARALNRAVKGVVGHALITRDGDFLGDPAHPPLSDRVAHMRQRVRHGAADVDAAASGAWSSLLSSLSLACSHAGDVTADLRAAAAHRLRLNPRVGEDCGAQPISPLPAQPDTAPRAAPSDYGFALALSMAKVPPARPFGQGAESRVP